MYEGKPRCLAEQQIKKLKQKVRKCIKIGDIKKAEKL